MLNRRAFLTTSTAALAVSAAPGITREYRQLDDPFIKYDALGMADLVRSGEVSATELTEVVIRRAETLNPALNFMATPTYDRARSASISRETRFAGVPVLIKDMVDIGGIRRTDGSRLLAANIPAQSVAYTAALEASGLNIIGTTVVPEFANGLDSELYGSARNPWNLEYSCVASNMPFLSSSFPPHACHTAAVIPDTPAAVCFICFSASIISHSFGAPQALSTSR